MGRSTFKLQLASTSVHRIKPDFAWPDSQVRKWTGAARRRPCTSGTNLDRIPRNQADMIFIAWSRSRPLQVPYRPEARSPSLGGCIENRVAGGRPRRSTAITLLLNLAGTTYSAVQWWGADLSSAVRLEDSLFHNLLWRLTVCVSCGSGSFNLGSHHALFVVKQTWQAWGRVRRAGGRKRPSTVDYIATCCPE
jgi:hypothetical protein